MYLTAPDGCRLAYEEHGTGTDSIVFLHGIMMDRSVFSEQVQVLAETHRVIVADLRGHGESCKPEEGYTLEQYVADLGFLIDRLGLTNPVLAGWSMGGSVAIAFAASHPGVAKKLVLIGATPCLIQRPDWPKAVPPEAARQLGQALVADYAGGAAAFCQMMFPEGDAARGYARVLSVMQASSPHVTVACMNNIGGADLRPLLRSIKGKPGTDHDYSSQNHPSLFQRQATKNAHRDALRRRQGPLELLTFAQVYTAEARAACEHKDRGTFRTVRVKPPPVPRASGAGLGEVSRVQQALHAA